ncbi:MAG: hypothetical protein J6R99_01175, partial [Alphaproteobacteria bacterium]|nr:hypothetical protein [Alphaproteobacteria bacterium]
MLTIKRLISALFVVFFVSYTNVALAVTCSKGTWPTIYSCVQCEKGRFCVGGTCTPSTTGTQTVCEEGKGPNGVGIGVVECGNVLRGSTSDAGSDSADDCYVVLSGEQYVVQTSSQYVSGYSFYEVGNCSEKGYGYTSTCPSGSTVHYGETCECVAPEEIVNLTWYDGFGGNLPTTSFVNAVNSGYPSTGIVNRALTLPASPYVTQDGLFNGWEYDGGQIYNGEIPADSFTETGDVYMYANYSDDAMAVDFSNPAATGTLPSLSPDVEYSAADDNTVRLILEKGNCAPVYFDAEEMIDPDTPELIFVGWGIKNFSFRTYAQGLLYFFDGTPGYYCADGNKYGQRILNMEPVYYYPQFVIRYGKNADGATGTMSDIYCSAGDPGCLLSENKFEYTGYTFSGWNAKLTRQVLPLYAGPNDEIKGRAYNKYVQREQDLGVLSAGADVVEYANQ